MVARGLKKKLDSWLWHNLDIFPMSYSGSPVNRVILPQQQHKIRT
jgi:hypothetical protein